MSSLLSETTCEMLVEATLAAAKPAAGQPYTRGGQTPAGFDCSGFVTYVYRKVIPGYTHLNTDGIETSPRFTELSAPQPGGLILFPKGVNPYDGKPYPNHVAIVLDRSTWIGSQTSTGVAKVSMTNRWWSAREKYYLSYGAL